MSRVATLLDLKTRARNLADVENDENISDALLTSLANRHLCKVYDALIDASPPDYYAASATLSVNAGNSLYALPVSFRSLLGVFVQRNATGGLRTLRPMPAGSRSSYSNPTGGSTVTLEFIPTPPTLVSDGDTFDGVSGFEELVALMMARDVMVKRQDDPSVLMSNIEEEKNRILIRSRHRDRSGPKRITYLGDERANGVSFFGGAQLACYRLRGDTIEFFESTGGWR